MQTKRRDIFLVCATKPEWVPLKKKIPFTKMDLNAPLTLPSPLIGEGEGEGGLKLVQTGVGTKNLPKLFARIRAAQPRPSLICSFGLSGGLTDLLKVGDLVLPNQFVSDEGKPVIFPSPLTGEGQGEGDIADRARSVLKTLSYDFVEGTLFTSPHVLATPTEKREAGLKYDAVAVDMETYPLARFCRDENIRFLSLRSIFDPLSWDLSNMARLSMIDLLDERGDIKSLSAILGLISNPKLIFKWPHYQKSLSVGSKKIADLIPYILKFIES